jgi:hypothetical protein
MANISPEELASKLPGFRLVDGSLLGRGGGDGGLSSYGAPQQFAAGAVIPAGFWMSTSNVSSVNIRVGTYDLWPTVQAGNVFFSDGVSAAVTTGGATITLIPIK